MRWTLVAVALLMVGLAWAPAASGADRPSENIALGASCTLEPALNYEPCRDADDVKQLTDGVHVETQ